MSLYYSSHLLKFSGLDEINFIMHRGNASVRFRTFLFEDGDNTLTIGAKANYHIYYLQNLESQGAYNFTMIYGPSIGVFFSDPILARFMENDFLKNCDLEGEANFLLIPGAENESLIWGLEFYTGIFYKMDMLQFNLGYRFYSIMKNDINDVSHEIEFGIRYYF